MTPKSTYHPSWKIAVGIAAPMLTMLGILGWFIAPTREDAYLNAVFLITFSGIGWAGGMIFSPDSGHEAKKFSGLWKGISLFVSGYLLSKIDPLVEAVLKPEVILNLHSGVHTYRMLVAISATTLTAILTYVIRVYALTVGESRASD